MTDNILDFESRKKKKTKVTSSDQKEGADEMEDHEVIDFGSKKKKKDKPLSLEGAVIKDDDVKDQVKSSVNDKVVKELADKIADELHFSDKKKRKKLKPVDVDESGMVESNTASEVVVRDLSGYDYEMLLTRVFAQLGDLNPELVSDQKRKLVMVPPQMARVGTKKTLFVNFSTICRSLNRDQSHLTTYILTELGTQGSVDANGALLIRGRYTSKHMEPVLRNYCSKFLYLISPQLLAFS
uniref:Eukaryotic translation initiation factor 2 subunit 2 n=1 Tax=Trichobilharzia regenti TaxID=157069 RepID=A0AA85K2L9_TRIRE|nr:unnamed protein product [Trichobilharzia regenti]